MRAAWILIAGQWGIIRRKLAVPVFEAELKHTILS
jgi:hypothetical protein